MKKGRDQHRKRLQERQTQTLSLSEVKNNNYKTLSAVLLFNCSVKLTLWSHGLQHARLPSPSPTPRDCSNSCPSGWWCYPTISSSVVPFSSCLQSFPASWSFLMTQFFASGGQRIGASASASVLPMNIQDWFPLGLIGLISLQFKDSQVSSTP